VAAAAALAAWLLDKAAESPLGASQFPQIHIHEPGVWVQVGPNDIYYWGRPGKPVQPGKPADLDKWRWIQQRVEQRTGANDGQTRWFEFTEQGLAEWKRRD
jgi:hypothetical protein